MSADNSAGGARLLDGLWRLVAGPRVTLLVLLWLCSIIGLTLVVPQSPYSEDPLIRSQWLSSAPRELWPLIERLQPLGVFHLPTSVWLRLPLCVMLGHSLVVLASQVPMVWWRALNPAGRLLSPPEEWVTVGRSAWLSALSEEPGAVVTQRIACHLSNAGYRVDTDADGHRLIAWRWRWGWLATPGIYAGIVLLAAGLVFQSWLGQVHEIYLAPGAVVVVPGSESASLVLNGISNEGEDPGVPGIGLVAMLALTEDGRDQPFSLGLHRSCLLHGMWLTVLGVRPVAEVTAVDAHTGSGVLLQPFLAQAVPRLRARLPLTEDPGARFAGVPSQNVTLRVDYAAGADTPAERVSVSFFRGVEADPRLVVELVPGQDATFDGVRYQVALGQDVAVRVTLGMWWSLAMLGWAMIAGGCGLLVVGRPVWMRSLTVSESRGCRVMALVDTLADERVSDRLVREALEPQEET